MKSKLIDIQCPPSPTQGNKAARLLVMNHVINPPISHGPLDRKNNTAPLFEWSQSSGVRTACCLSVVLTSGSSGIRALNGSAG
ncbi:hypothetical protein JTE90_011470 [Oedothorax gibbosus]|uniref:Uncharacterized protein n=1 Tax=Oedothorax gibbosus TaxID=931172 RepID=A0AAV6VB67_9ARAC|nr:hypothetical protein JTE90_011470 [Oedothorax gibbosus]